MAFTLDLFFLLAFGLPEILLLPHNTLKARALDVVTKEKNLVFILVNRLETADSEATLRPKHSTTAFRIL